MVPVYSREVTSLMYSLRIVSKICIPGIELKDMLYLCVCAVLRLDSVVHYIYTVHTLFPKKFIHQSSSFINQVKMGLATFSNNIYIFL